MIYIFDLDGTLADCTHRLHFIDGAEKNWKGFFAACVHDSPITKNIDLLKQLRKAGNEIWIWTGRSDEVREQTVEWLREHKILPKFRLITPWESFLMRKEGDYRPDHVIKAEWLSEVEPPEYNQLGGVFEDRSRVVQMWREHGIPCFQVAEGDF